MSDNNPKEKEKPNWRIWRDDNGKLRFDVKNISVSLFIGKVIGYIVAGALTLGGADALGNIIEVFTRI